jgi:hypothetical protein
MHDAINVSSPFTIFQVLEIKHARERENKVDVSPKLEYDEFSQFVLCVKNLNKPTLKQIDQQRIDLVYWLSKYFGRFIPTELLLPIIDLDMSAESLNIFLPRVDLTAINASLEDVYKFLKSLAPLIEVSEATIDEWRTQQKETRLHQQKYENLG